MLCRMYVFCCGVVCLMWWFVCVVVYWFCWSFLSWLFDVCCWCGCLCLIVVVCVGCLDLWYFMIYSCFMYVVWFVWLVCVLENWLLLCCVGWFLGLGIVCLVMYFWFWNRWILCFLWCWWVLWCVWLLCLCCFWWVCVWLWWGWFCVCWDCVVGLCLIFLMSECLIIIKWLIGM